MGKLKAVIKAIIGIPCLLLGAILFATVFSALQGVFQGHAFPLEGLGIVLSGFIAIFVSGFISSIALFIAYVALRGLGAEWRGEEVSS